MLSRLFALSLLACFCLAAVTPHIEKRAQADTDGYENPANHGGSMEAQLQYASGGPIDIYTLNVIVSNSSTPSVLTDDGVKQWLRSLGYAKERSGNAKYTEANTGDGRGFTAAIALFETPEYIYHTFFWQQSSTKAYFLAAYQKIWTAISPDQGRGDIVERATLASTYFGGTSYTTTCKYVEGLYTYGPSVYTDAKCAVCTVLANNSAS